MIAVGGRVLPKGGARSTGEVCDCARARHYAPVMASCAGECCHGTLLWPHTLRRPMAAAHDVIVDGGTCGGITIDGGGHTTGRAAPANG